MVLCLMANPLAEIQNRNAASVLGGRSLRLLGDLEFEAWRFP